MAIDGISLICILCGRVSTIALRVVLEVLLLLPLSKSQFVEKTQRPNAHDELIKIGANHNSKSLGWNEYLIYGIAIADVLNYWRLQIGHQICLAVDKTFQKTRE